MAIEPCSSQRNLFSANEDIEPVDNIVIENEIGLDDLGSRRVVS